MSLQESSTETSQWPSPWIYAFAGPLGGFMLLVLLIDTIALISGAGQDGEEGSMTFYFVGGSVISLLLFGAWWLSRSRFRTAALVVGLVATWGVYWLPASYTFWDIVADLGVLLPLVALLIPGRRVVDSAE